MAGLPPTISAETGTPAHEWAQSTTTAAFARGERAPGIDNTAPPAIIQTTSSQSTPGQDLPGAFPLSEQGSSMNTQTISDTAKSAMQTVTDTAHQVVDVVSSYMPGSAAASAAAGGTGITGAGTSRASDHDVTHKTSLPSSEVLGSLPREHVGGAGALPGSYNEEGVIKLPDERSTIGTPVGTSTPRNASNTYPAPPYPPTAPSDVLSPANKASTVRHPQGTAVTDATSLPSQEKQGQSPFTHVGGVGMLPGKREEQGVAVLPDETSGGAGVTGATSSASGTNPRTYDSPAGMTRPSEEEGNERRVGREAVGGVGALVGGKEEEGVAKLPDERTKEDVREQRSEGGLAGVGGTGASQSKKGDKVDEMNQPEREERHDRVEKTAESKKDEVKKETHGQPSTRNARMTGKGTAGSRDDARMDLLHANVHPRTHTLGSPGAVWHGIGVGTNAGYQDGGSVDIEKRAGEEEVRCPDYARFIGLGSGYESGYHPAELHPGGEAASTAQPQEQDTEQDTATKSDTPKEGGTGVSASASSGSEKAKKASFLDKMKGEAKVLMGKMEGKKGAEKVQEGKRMKSGEA
ncbi:uncharacterized protein FIBRA_06319 [Fibroporia radiculosa]|uniref:CsbD-like domain-containing protein n=1 Tax=Fibroporia radiculosa TaxID=599839 RepID=J4HYX5_9APHY|nr:uncharacterized protein FIBRA_06319 [Fibroporia radiculosa]CCM04157.1 predicted protein [Fibroporia radiculosa]